MLPAQYQWLNKIGTLPLLVQKFIDIYGTKEVPGTGNSPTIMGWAKFLKLKDFIADSIAWCGLAMAYVVTMAGYAPVLNPLWALNWGKFGQKVPVPMLGDVCSFYRYDAKGKLIGGHVGLYIAEDDVCYHIGGGNSSDETKIVRIEKSRLASANRPVFKKGQPATVKRYFVTALGAISKNEA